MCVRACVHVCVCMRACVCWMEGERERERERFIENIESCPHARYFQTITYMPSHRSYSDGTAPAERLDDYLRKSDAFQSLSTKSFQTTVSEHENPSQLWQLLFTGLSQCISILVEVFRVCLLPQDGKHSWGNSAGNVDNGSITYDCWTADVRSVVIMRMFQTYWWHGRWAAYWYGEGHKVLVRDESGLSYHGFSRNGIRSWVI